MSSSSRLYGESDSARIELPVFVAPTELVFTPTKRRSSLIVFNPYGNEGQFMIMTTSPDRYDVSVTKGSIKPKRRIEIMIKLLSQKVEELPELTEELQVVDYFRVTMRIGDLKGNRAIKVHWGLNSDALETEESRSLIGGEERTSKVKLKSPKNHPSGQLSNTTISPPSHITPRNARTTNVRVGWSSQVDNSGSNVNLDSDLCKKAKAFEDTAQNQYSSIFTQLSTIFSVSYELKLGCSFALGLFTYRLISTLPV